MSIFYFRFIMLSKVKTFFIKPENNNPAISERKRRLNDCENDFVRAKKQKLDDSPKIKINNNKSYFGVFTDWLIKSSSKFFTNALPMANSNRQNNTNLTSSSHKSHSMTENGSNSNNQASCTVQGAACVNNNFNTNNSKHVTNEFKNDFRQSVMQSRRYPCSNVYTKIYGKYESTPKRFSKSGQLSAINSIRLNEKRKYADLLQSFCSHTILPPFKPLSYQTENFDSFERNFHTNRMTSTPANSRNNFINLIDLTNYTPKKDDKKLSSDEKLIPKKFEDRLKNSKYANTTWINDLTSKYSEDKRRKDQEIERSKFESLYYQRQREALKEQADIYFLEKLKLSEKLPHVLENIEEEIEESEEFPVLNTNQESIVNSALERGNEAEELIQKFNIPIRRCDISTLKNLNWLNDEIINYYLNLIVERNSEDKDLPVAYAYNTFFFTTLRDKGYSAVRRWTRKVDIFSKDLLLVPIHLGMHWCMCVMDIQRKKIMYFDSMGGRNNNCLMLMKNYLESEMNDKKKTVYDTSDWELLTPQDIPQQMNGSDCGMFSCKFAEYYSRRAKFTFSQEHMPYFRRRMIYEILNGQLM